MRTLNLRRVSSIGWVFSGALLCLPGILRAQAAISDHTLTMVVPEVLQLIVDQPDVNIVVTLRDLQAGFKLMPQLVGLTARSNVPFSVTLESDAAQLTAEGGSPPIPSTDVQVKPAFQSIFSCSLSPTPCPLVSDQNPGEFPAVLDFRIDNLTFSNSQSDRYTVGLVYTIVAS